MKLSSRQLKGIVSTLEPGDLVDVELGSAYGPYHKIRAVKIVDDDSIGFGLTR